MFHAGDFSTAETVVIPFNTFSSNDPAASVTITDLVAGDVEIHKDGGATQRASDNGVTVSIDFDTVTGNHIVAIDLSDNSDAGFYAAGSRYQVRVEGTTIDGGTVNAWIGVFSIGCALRPTTAGRTLDVTAGGCAGIDWANVESPTTSNALTGTTISTAQKVDIETIKTQAITCGAGVNVAAYLGTAAASTAQTGDVFAALPTNFSSLYITASTGQVRAYTADGSAIATQATLGSVYTATVTNIPATLTSISTYVDCLPATLDGSTFSAIPDMATATLLTTVAGYLDTEIADILADTNELQTDWTDGGRLDLILDSVVPSAAVTITTEHETISARYTSGTHSILFRWYVEDVLTNVTTAKLSDATATYGVKRDDTSAVVVADGTAMTNDSTGVYSYSFTEPADDLTYTAWVEIVYSGNTYRFEVDITGTPSAATDAVSVTYNTLRDVVGLSMGLNTDRDQWTAAQADVVNTIIKSGLRRFYWPKTPEGHPEHEWTFLRKTATLSLSASDLDYDLPSDFGALYGSPVIDDRKGGVVDEISSLEILAMQARDGMAGMPIYCAVRPKVNDATVGTRYEMLLYPTPNTSETLTYQYVCEPGMLSATNQYPLGGALHGETIQMAVLAAMENIRGNYAGVHSQAFSEQLAASIRVDRGQRP